MGIHEQNGAASAGNVLSFPLPTGVHFEVPHDYARTSPGGPLRVTATTVGSNLVVVSWTAEVLRFASRGLLVEYHLPSVRGLLVDLAEPITGLTASTIRIWFVDPTSPWARMSSLPILTANPTYAESIQRIADILSRPRVPVRMHASPESLRVAALGPDGRIP